MHLPQCRGCGLECFSGRGLPGSLGLLPAFAPFSLLLPPSIHSLFVKILLGLLVVDGEPALLFGIEGLGPRAGCVSGLANRGQAALSGVKTLEQAGQPLLIARAEGEQALLFSQAFTLLG